MFVKKDSKLPTKSGKEVVDFASDFAYSLGLDPEILTRGFNEYDLLNTPTHN